MKLVFLDETYTSKYPEFYGLCAVSIDAAHYTSIASDLATRIEASGWAEGVEFKGRYLFSSKEGDPNVSIEQRIELARKILSLNVAQANAKLRATFAWTLERRLEVNTYLTLTSNALRGLFAGRKPDRVQGKNLCAVFADENNKVAAPKLRLCVVDSLSERGYVLCEDIAILKSAYHHVGMCYADLIAYLASWWCNYRDVRSGQLSFLQNVPTGVDYRKLGTADEMIGLLKRVVFIPKLT